MGKCRNEFLAALISASLAAPVARADAPLVGVRSPDGRVRLEFALQRHGRDESVPCYRGCIITIGPLSKLPI